MKDLTMENISPTWYQSTTKNEQKVFREWLHGLLKTEIVDLTFVKKDDTIREMKCTLMKSKLPTGYIVDPDVEIHENYIHVFDLEKQAWRSCRFDSIRSIRFTLGAEIGDKETT
jgi:hypothetical protein